MAAPTSQPPLGRLHVITDVSVQTRYTHLQLTQMAIEAGVPVLQYRRKNKPKAELLPEVQSLVAAARGSATHIIVNDFPDIAAAVGAAGVHVGQGDAAPAEAIATMPEGSIVGATVHTPAELEALRGLAITYIGVGPVFGTASKATGLPPLGTKMLAKIVTLSPFPVVAIGSIQLSNLPEVLDCGVHGVAILSSFCSAPNPVHAAQSFLDVIVRYRPAMVG